MGMYRGATSESALREYVESMDLILDIGGVLFDDVSTGHGSARLDREKIISIHPHHVEILSNICHINSQSHTYSPVWIGDVISNLIENIKPISSKNFPNLPLLPSKKMLLKLLLGKPSEPQCKISWKRKIL